MIIHVLTDIAQKARRHNTHRPKRNTRQVHVFITLRVGDPACGNHNRIRSLIVPDPRDGLQLLEETRTGQGNRFANICHILDSKLEHHGTANVMGGYGDKFVEKDVVVDAVADTTADNTDCKSEGGNSSDKVVGADDSCDNGGRDDNAANPQAGQDE